MFNEKIFYFEDRGSIEAMRYLRSEVKDIFTRAEIAELEKGNVITRTHFGIPTRIVSADALVKLAFEGK